MNVVLLAALSLLLSTICRAENVAAPVAIGRWIVGDASCTGCGKRTFPEIGTTIEIGPSQIKNPLYGDCSALAGLSGFGPVDSAELTRLHKVNRKWLDRALGGVKTILLGNAQCNKLNFMPLALINPDAMLYFFEGDVVFLLRRLP